MANTTANPAPTVPPHDTDLHTLTLEETATVLRHSLKTARALRLEGGHPVYNKLAMKVGNRVIFFRSDVYEYLRSIVGEEV